MSIIVIICVSFLFVGHLHNVWTLQIDGEIGDFVQGIEENETDLETSKLYNFRLDGQLQIKPKNPYDNILIPLEESSNIKRNIDIDERISTGGTEVENHKFEKILQLLNKINLDITDINNRINDIENIGFKSLNGVHYKPSDVRDGSNGSTLPRSCKEVLENGHNISGIYTIQPKTAKKPFVVQCDMDTRGGGWTYIQKRFDGSQDFFLEWRNYKFGFGDLNGEFWIGLENIHKMTEVDTSELLVELEDRQGNMAYAHYTAFGIGSEPEGYVLNVLKGFSGDAGDSLTYHVGSKFSTQDFDQDSDSGNCAKVRSGAWWYKKCFEANLNGKYLNQDLSSAYEYQGLHWETFINLKYSHAKSRMLIKPAY